MKGIDLLNRNFRDQTTLGRTGLRVSRLGIGSGYGVPAQAVEKAYHQYGVNYFFWSSPRRRGMREAIRNLVPSERERMVIALQTYDHIGLLMRHFVHKGLSALSVDYADVLILGWFNKVPGSSVLESALKLKQEGKVRFIGMSGHNRSVFTQLAKQSDHPIDILMTRYNAVHRGADKDIFPFLSEEDRPGVITYTATCWGKLLRLDKMPTGESPLSSDECYRFALSHPAVDLCLTGPRNEREMDEALYALDGSPLSVEDRQRVKRIGDYIHG